MSGRVSRSTVIAGLSIPLALGGAVVGDAYLFDDDTDKNVALVGEDNNVLVKLNTDGRSGKTEVHFDMAEGAGRPGYEAAFFDADTDAWLGSKVWPKDGQKLQVAVRHGDGGEPEFLPQIVELRQDNTTGFYKPEIVGSAPEMLPGRVVAPTSHNVVGATAAATPAQHRARSYPQPVNGNGTGIQAPSPAVTAGADASTQNTTRRLAV